MDDLLASLAGTGDLVAVPPLAELGARATQRLDQLLERRIADVVRAVGAQLRCAQSRTLLPIGEPLPPRGIHVHQPHVVARQRIRSRLPAKHKLKRAIPREVIPAPAEQAGGVGTEVRDQALERGRDLLGGRLAGRRLLPAAQQDQVRPLRRGQLQRA